jgi:predicted nucleic-acid-binding Zn-ribbon protein
LDEFKRALSCERCGFADFRALEFHHERTGLKDFNVADMIRSGLSVSAMMREIEKCIVLCSNCHQIEHYKERE